jgi:hypothetical protein
MSLRFHLAGSARDGVSWFVARVGQPLAWKAPNRIREGAQGGTVRRSQPSGRYGTPEVPVAPALLPHLAAAIDASPSELVFPASDGTMLSEDTNTERVLRSALARAGIVIGYDHTCRRCKAKGMSHVERQADANLRHCPRCHMKLWPRPLKSKMRFRGQQSSKRRRLQIGCGRRSETPPRPTRKRPFGAPVVRHFR